MKGVLEAMFAPMQGRAVDQSVVDKSKQDMARPLDVLERALAGKEYLAGGIFSLAEITYAPYIEYVFATGMGEVITSRPNVASWWGRISERPSWQKATGKAR
jgi:glutathione S-transferase